MEQKTCHKFIYKLHSKQLRRANWKINLPLDVVMRDYPENIVSLNDSQILRWIDELNGINNIDEKVKEIKNLIQKEKQKKRSYKSKSNIKRLYNELYNLQFQKDYICIIMDSNSDYDKANKGFSVNGIKYRRFLGTNGGIKQSTIVYVNELLYPELKRRLDNGRNKEVPFVPAKLEAYQALICSASIPLPEPKGVIVVNDCITHFLDNVIMLNDENDGEPDMKIEKNKEIEYVDSDGYGLMLPSYSKKVNGFLNGDDEHTLSGFNSRYSWTKGMIYTFDYISFAEKVANTYIIKDAWGDERDIRESEIILTTSMLKLWDSYRSWEDYKANCDENKYQLSASKVTENKLDNVRDTNYQFLQSYKMTNDEIDMICKPTVDELHEVLGLDYRKSLVYLAGFGLNEKNAFKTPYNFVKALMIDKRMIQDPFIRKRIHGMLKKRIDSAKKGSLRITGNFTTVCGDPYSLAQSMFGLKVTGILRQGETYHKYWIDKGTKEIACFRAPMTCHNNIRKLKLYKSKEADYWYQYINTGMILNSWDTTCDAMNGCDKDGDTFFTTDNEILLRNTLNSPTIMCVQRRAEKKLVTEQDIIQSNKLSFGDEIGVTTNHITSMIEVQSGFEEGSKEYNTLSYRIMCGQLYQQNAIDKAKGIISKPMPAYWYNKSYNKISPDDDMDTIKEKEFNMRIVADRKPYFMIYIYPMLKKKYHEYIEYTNGKSKIEFNKTMQELIDSKEKTEEEIHFLDYYEKLNPVGMNPCIVNRICWKFEREFDGFLKGLLEKKEFDYTILKSNVQYSKSMYESILNVYKNYLLNVKKFHQRSRTEISDDFDIILERQRFIDEFKKQCEIICSDEKKLCDIVLDICYNTDKSKQFAWDVCGDVIIKNLLEKNNYTINYPERTEFKGDFEYCGEKFIMKSAKILEEKKNDSFE